MKLSKDQLELFLNVPRVTDSKIKELVPNWKDLASETAEIHPGKIVKQIDLVDFLDYGIMSKEKLKQKFENFYNELEKYILDEDFYVELCSESYNSGYTYAEIYTSEIYNVAQSEHELLEELRSEINSFKIKYRQFNDLVSMLRDNPELKESLKQLLKDSE